jgi:hypothetical protein
MQRIAGEVLVAIMCALSLDVACSGSLGSAGTSCSSDNDCAAGLSCIGLAAPSDAGCTSVAYACSKRCRVDADCAAVGPKFRCFADCGTANTCGQTP